MTLKEQRKKIKVRHYSKMGLKPLKRRKSRMLSIIIEFIKNNIKEYLIITTIFIIGLFLGVMFINNAGENQKSEIGSYIMTYIETLKKGEIKSDTWLLQNNIKDNLILSFTMWFVGSTVVGIPIVFGIIVFRGFCLGYTISALTTILGVHKAIMFTGISIIMQNVIFIPAIISLGVSSLKTYKSILNDKRRENIKMEIIRHTVFSIVLAIFLIMSAVVETGLSTNLLKALIKYF